MMVGFLQGVPEIAQLELDGTRTLHLRARREFATLGAGRMHAAMAYEVLRDKSILAADGLAAIRDVTELAARYAPHCDLPVRIAHVVANRAEMLTGSVA
jgi:hypothetical protein